MKKTLVSFLAFAALASPGFARVHVTVRADGSKMIYNDEVDTRRYRPADMSDSWLARRRARPCPYDDVIRRVAVENSLDPDLVKAVMLVESGFNPRAVSRKGARGLMQLMPATATAWGVKNTGNVEQNVQGGAKYLTYLLNLYRGDLEFALAAYNAGETAVDRYAGIPPYDETQLYVHKTLTAYYGRPYVGGGFGRASTNRYRRIAAMEPVGRPVHLERDAENRVRLVTDSPAVRR
jgi:soluble lytic murein transglycosylase-like protein